MHIIIGTVAQIMNSVGLRNLGTAQCCTILEWRNRMLREHAIR